MGAAFAIMASLPAFSAVRPGDWGALEAAVRKAGVPAGLAAEVVAFVPIAFGRALMEGMGVEFSPDYAVPDGDGGTRIVGPLLEHPVYGTAATLAVGLMAQQEQGEAFVNAALWSSEFSAVNQALNAGSNPADLVASPPVILLRPGSDEAKRPWWRVWG
jgi:hypothetical protein